MDAMVVVITTPELVRIEIYLVGSSKVKVKILVLIEHEEVEKRLLSAMYRSHVMVAVAVALRIRIYNVYQEGFLDSLDLIAVLALHSIKVRGTDVALCFPISMGKPVV